VVPAGDCDRVELDRPEFPEDREDCIRAALERARRREELPGDEKGRMGTDTTGRNTRRQRIARSRPRS